MISFYYAHSITSNKLNLTCLGYTGPDKVTIVYEVETLG